MMRPSLKSFLAATFLAILLTACEVGPDFIKPNAPAAQRYTDTDLPAQTASAATNAGAAQSFAFGKDVPADWWRLFGSEPLNRLVQQALENNPDLKAAGASLRQARENYYAARGDWLPKLDGNLGPTRERFNPAIFGEQGAPPSIFTLYNASVSISYGIDIFGGTRREVEEAEALTNYQKFELQATYLTLTSNVVTAAIQEASLREQVNETQGIIDIESKQLNILQKQFEFGAIAKSVVLEQQATLAQTQAGLPLLKKQLAQQRNLLAVLAGKYTSDGAPETFDLASLHLPEKLPVTLPSKLVEQRPDIRAAEEQLHATSAAIGIATADMLPQITLSGSYGAESTHFNNLFSSSGEIWTIGGNLLQPLFHGGELLHQKRAAVAAFDKASAQYQSAVLQAFENVADTLKALEFDAEGLAAQLNAEEAAKSSLELSQEQLKDGAIGYPQLLDAEHSYQQARIGLVQAEAARLADTAALFQSLGGNWNGVAVNASDMPTSDSQPAPASQPVSEPIAPSLILPDAEPAVQPLPNSSLQPSPAQTEKSL